MILFYSKAFSIGLKVLQGQQKALGNKQRNVFFSVLSMFLWILICTFYDEFCSNMPKRQFSKTAVSLRKVLKRKRKNYSKQPQNYHLAKINYHLLSFSSQILFFSQHFLTFPNPKFHAFCQSICSLLEIYKLGYPETTS